MESEPNKPSIASVTIAHNSGATLIRQIEALKGQTYPLSEIVIVDNASVDNTGTLLEEKYPEITLLKMEKNIGAAGAWAVGLKHCISKGHDWFWTFDDDSLPELNTLEILQEGVCERCDRGPEVAMAVPLPVNQASGLPSLVVARSVCEANCSTNSIAILVCRSCDRVRILD
jgi:glycosyltransferase involved in cell wall biosynthesis